MSAQVRSIDVLPTILDLLGVTAHPRVRGRSLAPLMFGESDDPRPALSGSPHSGPDRVSVRFAGCKYIETIGPPLGREPLRPLPPEQQLFDLRQDAGEQRNLAAERPDLVERFQAMIREQRDPEAGTVTLPEEVDAELRARLRELGYVE